MSIKTDVVAERAVLAGICKYGPDLFLDITDLVKANTFSIDVNKVIFKCLKHICNKDHQAEIDLPSILSAAQELDFGHIFDKKEEAKHLSSIINLHTERTNVRRFAMKLRKLEIARLLYDQGEVLKQKMSEMDGTEAVSQILGTAENIIFDFTSLIDSDDEFRARQIGENLDEYIEYLENNPCRSVGIGTGFPLLDESIGGGLNPGVAVIGARAKVGKTSVSINIGYNIASRGIPVLYLDTEMIEKGKYRDISDKLLASVSDCDIKDIKTGAFASDAIKRQRVYEASKKIKDAKLYRIDISGKPFEDQLYAMRKWVQTEVGLNDDGTAKDCVIVYDYLKMMNMDGLNDSIKEFQALGVMMTALQNFGIRYAVPLLAFTQLNRDGIDKESSAVVSGSDRITWFCTSFTILKYKSDEEIATDGIQLGNRKFVTILSRYGPGHDSGEYVNAYMNKYRAQIREIDPEDIEHTQGFVIENDENDIPFE